MSQRPTTILMTVLIALQAMCTGLTVCMDGGTCHVPAQASTAAACGCGHHQCSSPTPHHDDHDHSHDHGHDHDHEHDHSHATGFHLHSKGECDCSDVVFGEIDLYSNGKRDVQLPMVMPELIAVALPVIPAEPLVIRSHAHAFGHAPPATALSLRAAHLRPVRLLL